MASRNESIAHYLPDFVFGANDGLITTFAIVSGVAGAQLATRVVLILGVANLLADGISMGASNYLSRRSAERPDDRDAVDALRHASVTIVGFVVVGAVPLAAYIAPIPDERQYLTALALTMATLFAVGAARAIWNHTPWFRSGLEMFLVGAAAAAVAYGVGSVGARVT
jgi:VIT1/CCC1 family predicted Fe2+/Mn2+ transporter